MAAVQKPTVFGYGRVLIAFHGKTLAQITMKPFSCILYIRQGVNRLLGAVISLLVTKWWPFKNLFCAVFDVLCLLFTGKWEHRLQ